MVQHGLPVDLDRVEAAIHHALGLLLTDRAFTADESDQYLQPSPEALVDMHRQRFIRSIGHEVMTIAAGLRIADDRAGRQVLCRLPVIMVAEPDNIDSELREACNKLIHATYADWKWESGKGHPRIYATRLHQLGGYNRRAPVVLLEERSKYQTWSVVIDLVSFLESAALALHELHKTDRINS